MGKVAEKKAKESAGKKEKADKEKNQKAAEAAKKHEISSKEKVSKAEKAAKEAAQKKAEKAGKERAQRQQRKSLRSTHKRKLVTATGGTCRIMNCWSSRGATDCKKYNWYTYKCLCKYGSCPRNGKCYDAITGKFT